MNEVIITTLEEFHQAVQRYDPNRDIFRGVLDAKYKLIPRLGRKEMQYRRPLEVVEKKMLRMFKDYAAPYLPRHDLSSWELLAIAQHHGLPTRLLDWSRNPLVAAYFAVEREFNDNSAVYVLKGRLFLDIEKREPFQVRGISKFIPAHITPRIAAQSGLFTVHPKPDTPFTGVSLDKLIIVKALRRPLKHILYRYGVHRASLFPGLDGTASHIQWLSTTSY